METLDDSTKDPWNADAVDAEKPKDEKAAEECEDKNKSTIIASIQNYNCSIGEFIRSNQVI